MTYRVQWAAAAFALGLALRIAALPLASSSDVPFFALWADTASAEGVGRIYGTGGRFPERRVLERGDVRTKVNYPPVLLYEFVAARATDLPLKALSVVADAIMALVLLLAARPRHLAPALAYWLNPAAIAAGSALGYVEPLMALPATAGVLAAASGWPGLAGVLMAAAMLTKQNALLALPAALLAVAAIPAPGRARSRAARFAAGGATVTIAATAQVARHGGAPNMLWSLASPLRDPFLSGNAANLWWLIGSVAPHVPIDVCRVAAGVMVIAVIAWTIVTARAHADASLCAAAAALSFHAYHVLAVSAHEPHLVPAVPLLALAAAGRPRFWWPFAVVSTIAALNVWAFHETAPVLAVVNCAALVWHMRVFARAARS